MRICIHDFSGHAFPIQLSRWLSQIGHDVFHLYCEDFETPRGPLAARASDFGAYHPVPVGIGRAVAKKSLIKRAVDEWTYGGRLVETLEACRPDVVLSGNGSPLVHFRASRWARKANVAYIYWIQDIYSLALRQALRTKPWLFREPVIRAFEALEFTAIREAAAAVVISDDFSHLLDGYGVRARRQFTVQNWAPADEITLRVKANPWACAHGLGDKFVFMYAGTLGMKHNPALIAGLARAFRDDDAVRIVVLSEGSGRQWLEEARSREGLENLVLMDFVGFEDLPDAMATGDVQIAILEEFAGPLSVPSKILTYIAAEKPILTSMPPDNHAARIITNAGVGHNVAPSDTAGFIEAARAMRSSSVTLDRMRRSARAYKRDKFDMELIGRRFLSIFEQASGKRFDQALDKDLLQTRRTRPAFNVSRD